LNGNDDSDSKEENVLKPNPILYAVAASTYFSDNLIGSFLFPYAVVLGASFDQMGLMRSARNLCQNFLQIGWGEISERFSKKLLVAMSYISSSCFITAFLFFRDPLTLLVLIILQSILWSANVPAWNSLLADYTKLENRGRVLGKIGSVSQFSGVTAMLIVALATYTQLGEMTASSFITPFTLSIVTAAIGGFLAFLMKESGMRVDMRSKISFLSPLLDKTFRIFLTVNGFFWFSIAFSWPLLPYIVVSVVHASIWQIAIISAVSGSIVSLTQPKFGSVIDRVGRKPILVISRTSFFLFPLLYAFATNWLHLLAINVLLSFSMSASMVSFRAYIIDSAPIGRRGNYIAATNMIAGLATFLGSLVGGLFTSQLSVSMGVERALFTGLIFSAVLRLISSSGLLLIKETFHKG